MSDHSEVDLSLDDVFTEAPRPPSPEPTVTIYEREREHANRQPDEFESESDWSQIQIRLIGSHPLWGHHLWNAARSFATYLDRHPQLYLNKNVLELGAGGGLPGLVAAKNGAKTVVLTDYPDVVLIDNLRHNVTANVPSNKLNRVHVLGYIWGHPIEPLTNLTNSSSDPADRDHHPCFDLIIMSDLIFNHSQHAALLKTAKLALRPTTHTSSLPPPCLLVFYTHHRPHLAHRDMEFFDKARQEEWRCEEVLREKFPPMFPEDPGEEEVRATVHGWKLTFGTPQTSEPALMLYKIFADAENTIAR